MRCSSQPACACGYHYDAESWAALPLFAGLTAEEISAIASPWPQHLVVEARVCASCERRASRLIDKTRQVNATGREAIAA